MNLPGKFSRTSLAASTLAGEFRSGTSADNNEMTEISCMSAGTHTGWWGEATYDSLDGMDG
jgi:hypothetical protein